MSRIAGQQDPPVAVPFGLPGLELVARQPGRFSQGQVRAEHAADAVLELGQGHRRVIVDFGGLVFGGLDQQDPRGERPEREHTAVCPGETRADPAQPGDVEVAVAQPGHRIGHGDLAQPVDLWIGGAGERDPGRCRGPGCARRRSPPGTGRSPVGPVRAAHVRGHRGVVLADPGHLVSAAYAGAELAGAFAEQALEPRLREGHRPYRGIRQV